MTRLFVLFVVLVVCVACRAPAGGKPDASIASCARFGQTCELSPGKLGTCVERAECAVPPCGFECQSQH